MSIPAVAVLGDGSSHGGSLVSTNQTGTKKLNGTVICVDGCQHSCPIFGHGTTSVTAIARKMKIEGKYVITYGATAGCGAVIEPPSRVLFSD